MEEQISKDVSDFEVKGKKIWDELVNDNDVRVEDVIKKAEDSLKERKMDAAGLLFDAAAKKLELRKMTLMSVGDMESLSDIVKHQLILMTKAGDAILKYLDKTEDILLFKKLDETAEKSFNEYSVALQFVRKLLVDASEIRKNVKYGAQLKDALNDADILLMKSYFKPKFNTREENVVNRKLCGRSMKEFLDANGEDVLNGDDAHDLWLILQQLDHPIYKDFLQQQIAFEQLRFPDNTLVVDPYGSACFKTIGEALDFAVKDAKFRYVRWLLGSEKGDSRTQFSILVQPEVYADDLKWKNVPKQMDIDIVGNVGVRKYTDAKGVEHPSKVVVKQTGDKLPVVKDVSPWMGLLEGLNQTLRLARLEIINESPDELRPTLFVSPGSPVEVIECLLQTAGAECVIVKGKNAQVTITGSAIDKSAKAFQVATEGRLIMKECRVEDIRGGIGEEDGLGGCDVVESGVLQVSDTCFIKTKYIFFSGNSRGIFNQCLFQGNWSKSIDTSQTGSLYKAVCLEEASRVSIQNSSFERYEVALFALKENNHVALGHSRVADSVKVGAEICDDASATLRNSEIDADLILGLFNNSKGKVTLENNTSSSKVTTRRKAAAASILVDSDSKPPTMIGPQYEIMDIACGEKEDTQTMMKRLMKEKKEEMAREKAAASPVGNAAGVAGVPAAAPASDPDCRIGCCGVPKLSAAVATKAALAVNATEVPAAVEAAPVDAPDCLKGCCGVPKGNEAAKPATAAAPEPVVPELPAAVTTKAAPVVNATEVPAAVKAAPAGASDCRKGCCDMPQATKSPKAYVAKPAMAAAPDFSAAVATEAAPAVKTPEVAAAVVASASAPDCRKGCCGVPKATTSPKANVAKPAMAAAPELKMSNFSATVAKEAAPAVETPEVAAAAVAPAGAPDCRKRCCDMPRTTKSPKASAKSQVAAALFAPVSAPSCRKGCCGTKGCVPMASPAKLAMAAAPTLVVNESASAPESDKKKKKKKKKGKGQSAPES